MNINRGIIVVRPKQPYVDWANTFEDDSRKSTVESMREDSSAYLVPCWDDDDHFERVLNRVFRWIFDNELAGWITDESMWPQRRGITTFKKWFEIESHSMAYELGDGGIAVEDYETYN